MAALQAPEATQAPIELSQGLDTEHRLDGESDVLNVQAWLSLRQLLTISLCRLSEQHYSHSFQISCLLPLHRGLALSQIEQTASIEGLLDVFGDARFLGEHDEEFKEALKAAVLRIARKITNKTSLLRLIRYIALSPLLGEQAANEVVEILRRKVQIKEIIDDDESKVDVRELNNCLARVGGDFLSGIEESDLIAITLVTTGDDLSSTAQPNALDELIRRKNEFVSNVVKLPPETVMRMYGRNGPEFLRKVLVQVLLSGNIANWEEAFNEHQLLEGRVALFIGDAFKEGFRLDDKNIDDIVYLLYLTNHSSFFYAVGNMIASGATLPDRIITETERRLVVLINSICTTSESENIYPQQTVEYLCETHPDIALRLWNKLVPGLLQQFPQARNQEYAQALTVSVLRGFVIYLMDNPSSFDSFNDELPSQARVVWEEARDSFLWQMILKRPDGAEEFIEQFERAFLLGSYESTLTTLRRTVSSLLEYFPEKDRCYILSLPQVRKFFDDYVFGKVFQPGIARLLKECSRTGPEESFWSITLDDDYGQDEVDFLSYHFLADASTDSVINRLNKLKKIKREFTTWNFFRDEKVKWEEERENDFWLKAQVWVAILMNQVPSLLDNIISSCQSDSQFGYNELEDSLRTYTEVLLATNENFVTLFFEACSTKPSVRPSDMWLTLKRKYSLSEIFALSEDKILELLNG